jgi:uncharacterized membrane protein YdjX (TVP38/TMEM64 family)
MDPATRRQLLGVATLVVVAVLAAVTLSPATVAREVAALAGRPVLFGGLLFGAYLCRFLVAWPISVLSVLVGVALGPSGIPVALAGAVVTCLPPYLLAGRIGETVGPLGTLGRHGKRYFTSTGTVRGVMAARLAPLPADPVSYTAGLAKVPVGPYVLGTVLGELPWVTAAVLVGASAEAVTTEGLAPTALVVGAAALAVLLLSGPAYRALRSRGLVSDPL